MTMPQVARVFFAVDFSPEMKEALGEYISLLKKKAKSHSIRWTKRENVHITLQFLAEIQTEHIPLLLDHVKREIAAVKPTTFQLRSISLFPSRYRPRVIVAELFPTEELTRLSRLIGDAIKAVGYEVEQRLYRPHVTLGRLKHVQDPDLRFLDENPLPVFDKVTLGEVVLFRSDPQPDGSCYTPLERIALHVCHPEPSAPRG
jgi:2'-5' RNA ligase